MCPESKIRGLKGDINHVEEDIKNLRRKTRKCMETLSNTKEEVIDLILLKGKYLRCLKMRHELGQLSELMDNIKCTDENIKDLKQKVKKCKEKRSEMKQEIDKIRRMQENYNLEHIRDLKSGTVNLQYEVKQLDKKCNDLKRQVRHYKEGLSEMKKEEQPLKWARHAGKEMQKLRQLISEKNRETEHLHDERQLMAEEDKQLKAQKDNFIRTMQTYRNRQFEMQEKNKCLSQELFNVEKELKETQQQNKNLEDELTQRDNKIKRLSQELSNVEKELKETRQQKITLEEKQTQSDYKNKCLSQELSNVKKELKETRQQKKTLEEQTQSDYKKLANTSSDIENGDGYRSIAKSGPKKSKRQKKREIDQLQEKVKPSQRNGTSTQDKIISNLGQKLKMTNEKLEMLEVQIKEVKDNEKKLLETIRNLNEEHKKLQQITKRMNDEKERFQKENKKLKNDQIVCQICLHKPIKTIFLHCCHAVCCEECCKKLKRCPLCRSPIRETLKCFLA